MQRSERDIYAVRASSDLEYMIHKKASKLELTDIELLQCLASVQQTTLKYMLREERHGDRETPAGLDKED